MSAPAAASRRGHFDVLRLAIALHPQRQLLAGLVGAQDAAHLLRTGGLATIDGQDDIAILQLERGILARTHHQHPGFHAEVAAQPLGQRRDFRPAETRLVFVADAHVTAAHFHAPLDDDVATLAATLRALHRPTHSATLR